MNDFLAAAPNAVPLYGRLIAMLSVDDFAVREARILGDGEIIETGNSEFSGLIHRICRTVGKRG